MQQNLPHLLEPPSVSDGVYMFSICEKEGISYGKKKRYLVSGQFNSRREKKKEWGFLFAVLWTTTLYIECCMSSHYSSGPGFSCLRPHIPRRYAGLDFYHPPIILYVYLVHSTFFQCWKKKVFFLCPFFNFAWCKSLEGKVCDLQWDPWKKSSRLLPNTCARNKKWLRVVCIFPLRKNWV